MRLLTILMLLLATPVLAKEKSFTHWLDAFKKEALAKGISQKTLDAAFAHTAVIENIIALDRKQPEGTKNLLEYIEAVVTSERIEEGKKQLKEHRKLLAKIEEKYGVDKEVIVALWGIETHYGENTGNFPVVDALATLAYDGRRSDFFRDELFNALRILEDQHISPEEMSGSWAGAMGQCQFMPSSFLEYAADENGDGKRDIWNSQEDVFGSIAKYLKAKGWNFHGETAMPVILPEGFKLPPGKDIDTVKTTYQWRQLGVTYNDDSALVSNSLPASVILVGREADAVPYLVYDNYKVILQWNRSRYFATAVDMLTEELRQE